jgi:hypothetical protein
MSLRFRRWFTSAIAFLKNEVSRDNVFTCQMAAQTPCHKIVTKEMRMGNPGCKSFVYPAVL